MFFVFLCIDVAFVRGCEACLSATRTLWVLCDRGRHFPSLTEGTFTLLPTLDRQNDSMLTSSSMTDRCWWQGVFWTSRCGPPLAGNYTLDAAWVVYHYRKSYWICGLWAVFSNFAKIRYILRMLSFSYQRKSYCLFLHLQNWQLLLMQTWYIYN